MLLGPLFATSQLVPSPTDSGRSVPPIQSQQTPSGNRNKQKIVALGIGGAYAGTLLLLNEAWYRQYPRTRFQTFNDGREWLQVDKLGHGWSAYQLGRGTTALWQTTGMNDTRAVVLGSAGSLAFLTLIEWMDGHSQKWGWSWADIAANTGGVLLFAGQQLGWKEQRIQMKFSVAPQRYTNDLEERADNLFGSSFPERLLKDYNAQTYWISANLKSFLPERHIPAWFNVAIGYGAAGMFGGFENKAYDKDGNLVFSRTDIPRQRQWFLAPDIDLTRIKTNRKAVRTLLFMANCLKFPAPALSLSGGKLRFIPIAF